jgi:hypothetical protein
MHILAEEVLKLKELVDGANQAINAPSPDIAGASALLVEASNFLTGIVEVQPRPARAAETS